MTEKHRTFFYCRDERWDPIGNEPYESVQDFLDMCIACHGEAPEYPMGCLEEREEERHGK